MSVPPNKRNAVFKRNDYLCWDDFFMAATVLTLQRGQKQPHHLPDASIIVDENQFMLKEAYSTPTEHSVIRVVANVNKEILSNCSMYTTQFPCLDCAKVIVETSLKTIVYLNNSLDQEEQQEVEILFQNHRLYIRKFKTEREVVKLTFDDAL